MIITQWQLPNGIFEDTAVILMRKHPFLRARFNELNGEGFLEEMAQLVSPVAQSKNRNWEAELEEQLLQPYQIHIGPLRRLVVMPYDGRKRYTNSNNPYQYTLIFGFHHAIMDATSSKTLIKDILATIGHLARNEIRPDDDIPSLPVLVPIDYLHGDLNRLRCPSTMFDYIRFVFEFSKVIRSARKDFKSKNEWLKKFPLEQELNPGCEVKTKYIPLEFSPAITKNLISGCKQHGVTVHGALCTVLAG